MMQLSKILIGLKRYIRQRVNRPQENLRLFISGAFVFALGFAIVVVAGRWMQPSVDQELVVLFGLFVLAVGSARAIWGYLGISVFRVIVYFFRDE